MPTIQLSKDLLRKQHTYNKQSSKSNLAISLLFALLFSLNNLGFNQKFANLIVGIFLLIFLYNNLKDNYLGDLYESRIVNANTTDSYEKTLLKIKTEDLKRDRKWYEVWFISYFGFGFKNWIQIIIGHLLLLFLIGYLIFNIF